MDDCHPYYDKNGYTTSRYGWLQAEWLNKETALKVFQESSWHQHVATAKNYLSHITPEKMHGCNHSVKEWPFTTPLFK